MYQMTFWQCAGMSMYHVPCPREHQYQQREAEGWESLQLVVKHQHRGVIEQRGQEEASAAKEASAGGIIGGGSQRSSQAASTTQAPSAGQKRARDPLSSSGETR